MPAPITVTLFISPTADRSVNARDPSALQALAVATGVNGFCGAWTEHPATREGLKCPQDGVGLGLGRRQAGKSRLLVPMSRRWQ